MPPGSETIVIIVALFLGMYLLMVRPQKKQQQQAEAMRSALKDGDRIMLTSGIFATVRHIGERQLIVELAPETEVTILREAILRVVQSEEEEFEYADDEVEDDSAEPQADTAEANRADTSLELPACRLTDDSAESSTTSSAAADDSAVSQHGDAADEMKKDEPSSATN